MSASSHTPDVSVITPCHQPNQNHLPRLYATLIDQPIDWEWIVILDGLHVAPTGLWDHDARVRMIPVPVRHGAGTSRNIGAAHARGPLLRFIDADDTLLPGGLAFDAERACTQAPAVLGRALIHGVIEPTQLPVGDLAAGFVPELIDREPIVQRALPLTVRATQFWRCGGYAGFPRMEDWALIARLNINYRIHVVDDGHPSIVYHQGDQQTTEQPFPHWFSGHFARINSHLIDGPTFH